MKSMTERVVEQPLTRLERLFAIDTNVIHLHFHWDCASYKLQVLETLERRSESTSVHYTGNIFLDSHVGPSGHV